MDSEGSHATEPDGDADRQRFAALMAKTTPLTRAEAQALFDRVRGIMATSPHSVLKLTGVDH